jgi:hypothetical protein
MFSLRSNCLPCGAFSLRSVQPKTLTFKVCHTARYLFAQICRWPPQGRSSRSASRDDRRARVGRRVRGAAGESRADAHDAGAVAA